MALISRRFAADGRLQAAARNTPPLRAGATGSSVARLQGALLDLGFPMPDSTHRGRSRADGLYGDETTRRVRDFQTQQGLAADGRAGRDTLGRLDEIFAAEEATRSSAERMEAALNLWT